MSATGGHDLKVAFPDLPADLLELSGAETMQLVRMG